MSQERTQQKIPKQAIICRVVEIEGRNYVEIPLANTKWLVGSPDKRVLELYKENNYTYNDISQDRNWQKFLNNIKRRTVWALVKQVNRTKALAHNKIQDIYTVYIAIHGENSRDGHEQDSRMIGVWREPTFTKERDLDTEQLKTVGVDSSLRVFDFNLDINDPKSVANIKYLLEHTDPEVQLNVSPSPDAKSQTVYDPEGFTQATFSELQEMGQRTMSLAEVRQLRQTPYYPQVLKEDTNTNTNKK